MAAERTIELDEQELVVSREPDGSICIEADDAKPIRMHPAEAAVLVAALNWELLKDSAAQVSA
jgi:hypothetical protein